MGDLSPEARQRQQQGEFPTDDEDGEAGIRHDEGDAGKRGGEAWQVRQAARKLNRRKRDKSIVFVGDSEFVDAGRVRPDAALPTVDVRFEIARRAAVEADARMKREIDADGDVSDDGGGAFEMQYEFARSTQQPSDKKPGKNAGREIAAAKARGRRDSKAGKKPLAQQQQNYEAFADWVDECAVAERKAEHIRRHQSEVNLVRIRQRAMDELQAERDIHAELLRHSRKTQPPGTYYEVERDRRLGRQEERNMVPLAQRQHAAGQQALAVIRRGTAMDNVNAAAPVPKPATEARLPAGVASFMKEKQARTREAAARAAERAAEGPAMPVSRGGGRRAADAEEDDGVQGSRSEAALRGIILDSERAAL